MKLDNRIRCGWAGSDPLYIRYHDTEWGVPLYDDRKLFEFLILEGMQAGLSWITILRKREHYQKAFDHFDARKIARYDRFEIDRLLGDRGIVRNERKIRSAIENARAFLEVQGRYGSFSGYIWRFVGEAPIRNAWKSTAEIPAQTEESAAMSAELKKEGFRFVGPTICYAFMQAVGMVNDHIVDCFRYRQIG